MRLGCELLRLFLYCDWKPLQMLWCTKYIYHEWLYIICVMLHSTVCVFMAMLPLFTSSLGSCCCTLQAELCVFVMYEINIFSALYPFSNAETQLKKKKILKLFFCHCCKSGAYSFLVLYRNIQIGSHTAQGVYLVFTTTLRFYQLLSNLSQSEVQIWKQLTNIFHYFKQESNNKHKAYLCFLI